LKDNELIDKAIEKAIDMQKNDIDLDMITVPFLEGLAKQKLESYDQVYDLDSVLTKSNDITIKFLGFKSFKDMYLVARSNDNLSGTGRELKVKHFDNEITIKVPEDSPETISKATMDNSMSKPDMPSVDKDGTPKEPMDSIEDTWEVMFADTEDTKVSPTVLSQFDKDIEWSHKIGNLAKGKKSILYLKDGKPTGVAQLVTLKKQDSFLLAGFGSNEDISLRVLGDVTLEAIKSEFTIVINADNFDDTTIPYLVAIGYTKQGDNMYIYEGAKFPEELKVVIDNGF